MSTKKSVAGTASDPTIKFATVEIDGDKYKLAYSFNAIAEAEAMAGCNLLQGMQTLQDLSATQLRGLFYAALSVARPSMTIEEAGKLLRFDTMPAITNAIADAYILSMPKKEEPAEGSEKNEAPTEA
jgi:hypothetical protein